jgi:hypothetical protein
LKRFAPGAVQQLTSKSGSNSAWRSNRRAA